MRDFCCVTMEVFVNLWKKVGELKEMIGLERE